MDNESDRNKDILMAFAYLTDVIPLPDLFFKLINISNTECNHLPRS